MDEGSPAPTHHFTEVAYRNGQARIAVEPIPNPKGERFMLCLNPDEALAIIKMKRGKGYSLPLPNDGIGK